MITKTNVVTMKQNAEFDDPQLEVMNGSTEQMRDARAIAEVAALNTNYLPSLLAKSRGWCEVVIGSRSTLENSCQAIAIELDLAVSRVRSYQEELAQMDDEEDQEDAVSGGNARLARAIKATGEEASKLESALSNMSDHFDPAKTKAYWLEFASGNEQLIADIQQLTEARDVFSAQRKVITNAMATLEAVGLMSIGEDAILTAEKIAGMGMQPPKMALVQMALDQMKKTLADAQAAFSYLSMVAERDGLRKKIDAKSDAITVLEKSNLLVIERMKFLTAVHTMDEQRKLYRAEFKKVVSSVNLFLTINAAATMEDADASLQFINNASQLVSYLSAIR
ncbi:MULTISPECIES: alpha-xenorhabdolysin family binary toxin subunit B [unclassified Pseudomonas]|uniref:alpha-xenorhabdolysin family binary toxin subunit B n=1 Tax=unclassified Pseudomonas TaxID=196821 RepID=UPI002AC9068F|nr:MULTISPECIES: alpha-xenorhabdolysin family binary toxin subunit B [unclassified Pseudomonas]MEB0040380.1 alpha-xenorhabdolysin family binary toxin subunit B [Pseudomonas sp. MH10]MEB0120881.1 alpha-xenorhabdolysin family binary toxin subunit B [Pseudomonas sp. CCI1.2]WPX61887.1 alpha-xenorhabdolysin family binary toxin subunit B [Pseudomonas sp. MH10]